MKRLFLVLLCVSLLLGCFDQQDETQKLSAINVRGSNAQLTNGPGDGDGTWTVIATDAPGHMHRGGPGRFLADGSSDNDTIRQAGMEMVTRLDNERSGSGQFDKHASSPVITGDGFHFQFYYSGTYYDFGANNVYTSSDGVTWSAGTALTFTGGGANDWVLAVAWYESGWKALARKEVSSGGIHYYTSSGDHTGDWTDQGEVISEEYDWETAALDPTGVIKVGSTYYCYYNTAPGGDQRPRQTGVATSTDLATWTKQVANPIFSGYRFCPFVIKSGTNYLCFIAHEPAGSANTGGNHGLSEIEVWRCASPTFLPGEREFLGVAWGLSETSTDWDACNIDTPCIVTSNIERTTFPASTLQCYYYATDKDGNNAKTGYVTGPTPATLDSQATGFMGGKLVLAPGNYDIQDICYLREGSTLEGYGAILNVEAGTWGSVIGLMPGQNTTVRGLTIRDDDASADYGVYVRGIDRVTLENCTFDGCNVYLRTSHNTVRDCLFRGKQWPISIVAESGSNDVHGNLIERCVGYALADDSDATRGARMIYLEGADHTTIRNCIAWESAGLINIYTGSDYNVIRDSICEHIRLGDGFTALVNIASGCTGNRFENVYLDCEYLASNRRGFWDSGTQTFIDRACRVVNYVDDFASTPVDPHYEDRDQTGSFMVDVSAAASGVSSTYQNGRLECTLTLTGSNSLEFEDGSDRGVSVKLADLDDGQWLVTGAYLDVTDSDSTNLTNPGGDAHYNVAVGYAAVGATDATPTDADETAFIDGSDDVDVNIGTSQTATSSNTTAAVVTTSTSAVYLNVGVTDAQIDAAATGDIALTGKVVILLQKVN